MLKYFITFLAFSFVQIILAETTSKRVVCYFDSDNFLRKGNENFTQYDLEHALPLCTHLVYGYAGITCDCTKLIKLNVKRIKFHYGDITVMKVVYPHLKIYLSMGGDRDIDKVDAQKYTHFMQSNKTDFIRNTIQLLQQHHFDGLDLAYQFPRNESMMDKHESESFKQNFTKFVEAFYEAAAKENISLSLTVLPNVNSTHFLDISKIYNKFEYINLFAFDFSTPSLSPKIADYTAPIYFKNEQNRLPYKNVDFQVKYWLKNGCPADKLNLGIPTYARTWTRYTSSSLMPIIGDVVGPGTPARYTQKYGILSYTEVCTKAVACVNVLEFKYGSYSICPADEDGIHHTWMAYDGPEYAAAKVKYAKEMGLGGVAIDDVSFDDFKGVCSYEKYPILHSIRNYL